MTRIIETAKGNYKLLANEKGTLAVNTIVKDDMYHFDKCIDELSDDEVQRTIESTLVEENFDADFLHDDFSWVHDFQQW